MWHGALNTGPVGDSLIASRFELRAQIIWSKSRPVIGRGHYNWAHEPCWYAVRSKGTGHWAGLKGGDSTLWQILHQKSETGHGTQKPMEAMRRPMLNNSTPGDAVYDPFGGSGTTLIAAEQTERICYMMEIDPGYCDVIRERYRAYTED